MSFIHSGKKKLKIHTKNLKVHQYEIKSEGEKLPGTWIIWPAI